MSDLPSFQTLYDAGKAEAIARSLANGQPLSDWSEGSGIDIDLGIVAAMGEELTQKILRDTRKVFLDLATGPDLDAYAYDRFRFTRNPATRAGVLLTFFRPPKSPHALACTVPAGTTALTDVDVDGNLYSFTVDTDLALALDVLSGQVTATCSVAGSSNVGVGQIKNIQEQLSDSTISVINAAVAAGGNDVESDSVFRFRVRKGAAATGTADAVLVGVLTDPVPVAAGVRRATLNDLVGESTLFVGDQSGNSSTDMVAAVVGVLPKYRSAGVNVFVTQTTHLDVIADVACVFRPGRDSSTTRTRIQEAAAASINDITGQAGATLYRDVVASAVHLVADPLGLLSCSVKLGLLGGLLYDQDLEPSAASLVLTTTAGRVTTR
jgi:hypothetical protein